MGCLFLSLFVTLRVGRAVRSGGIYFEQLLCRCLWVDFHSVFTFFSEVIALLEPLDSSYFRRYVPLSPAPAIRQIRRVVGKEVTSQLVSVFVLSRLDYCNSLLAGLPSTTVKPLQRVQNAAVRLVFVWYLTLAFVIMRHLDYNSSTGYLSSTELHLSYVCSCI